MCGYHFWNFEIVLFSCSGQLGRFFSSGHIPFTNLSLKGSSYTGKVRVNLETDIFQPVGSKWSTLS